MQSKEELGIGGEDYFWWRSLAEFQIGPKSWVLEMTENRRLWAVGSRWALNKKFKKGDNLSNEARIAKFEIYKKKKKTLTIPPRLQTTPYYN